METELPVPDVQARTEVFSGRRYWGKKNYTPFEHDRSTMPHGVINKSGNSGSFLPP
jgi:hypothetical protein